MRSVNGVVMVSKSILNETIRYMYEKATKIPAIKIMRSLYGNVWYGGEVQLIHAKLFVELLCTGLSKHYMGFELMMTSDLKTLAFRKDGSMTESIIATLGDDGRYNMGKMHLFQDYCLELEMSDPVKVIVEVLRYFAPND